MTDPAIEAAQRAIAMNLAYLHLAPRIEVATLAAREALAPLRAKHQKVQRLDGSFRCTSCRDGDGAHADWPTGTDRLIYPSEDL